MLVRETSLHILPPFSLYLEKNIQALSDQKKGQLCAIPANFSAKRGRNRRRHLCQTALLARTDFVAKKLLEMTRLLMERFLGILGRQIEQCESTINVFWRVLVFFSIFRSSVRLSKTSLETISGPLASPRHSKTWRDAE